MEDMIQVFENKEFGKVRTVVINGEPWFVGKDVAVALGYKDTADALKKHIDNDDKLTRQIADSGQNRTMYIINESGIYSLIFSSKLPQAKSFKHWVTSEVLPAIRKTGSYNLPSYQIADPIERAKKWIEEEQARQELQQQNQLMKPKADFYDTVVSTESLLSIGDTAKLINKKGVGRNNLYKILKARKILMTDNIPYQQYIERGYFKVVESYYMAGDNKVITKTTYVKQKGVDYIRKLLTSEVPA